MHHDVQSLNNSRFENSFRQLSFRDYFIHFYRESHARPILCSTFFSFWPPFVVSPSKGRRISGRDSRKVSPSGPCQRAKHCPALTSLMRCVRVRRQVHSSCLLTEKQRQVALKRLLIPEPHAGRLLSGPALSLRLYLVIPFIPGSF